MIGAKVIEFESEFVMIGDVDDGEEYEIIRTLILEKDGKKYRVFNEALDWEYEECIIEEVV